MSETLKVLGRAIISTQKRPPRITSKGEVKTAEMVVKGIVHDPAGKASGAYKVVLDPQNGYVEKSCFRAFLNSDGKPTGILKKYDSVGKASTDTRLLPEWVKVWFFG